MEIPTFRRIALAYGRAWGVGLCLVEPGGRRVRSHRWWPGRDNAAQRELLAFNLQEGLRWGEPTVSYGAGGRLVWSVPLMHNAEVLGGLVAGIDEDRLFPGGIDAAPMDLRTACRELRERVEAENLTNAALLAGYRQLYQRERDRAETIHQLKADGPGSLRRLYLREEPQLIAAIRQGNRGEARAVLNGILTVLVGYAEDRFELMKSFFMELVAAVCRTAVEAGAEPEAMLGANFQSMTELASIHTLEDLAPWLHQMLERTMDEIVTHRQSTGAILVSDAVAYMHQHLQRPIGRDDVAAAVCLSPSHFSRLFKHHMGQNFIHTLTQIRLERAKELLIRTDDPVGDVARLVGFTDQGYFAKVFHRHTGQTPRDYREAHG
ncbi:MAG: helix-turn-helix transcriptional regulator [Planctomycetota bacterium]